MSIWIRISDALKALKEGEPLSAVFDRLRAPPEKSVAFTIAVIALGAKAAKADGRVTRNEVAAFREVFTIAPSEEENAARLFNLARQDVAGYEDYARRIAAMFRDQTDTLTDLLEGLFHIALADGAYHPAENIFLVRVAEIFGLAGRPFDRIRARFVPDGAADPYEVLGVAPEMTLAEIRSAWRDELKATHPDVLMGHGVPPEALQLAEKRLKAINQAWEQIRGERAA